MAPHKYPAICCGSSRVVRVSVESEATAAAAVTSARSSSAGGRGTRGVVAIVAWWSLPYDVLLHNDNEDSSAAAVPSHGHGNPGTEARQKGKMHVQLLGPRGRHPSDLW